MKKFPAAVYAFEVAMSTHGIDIAERVVGGDLSATQGFDRIPRPTLLLPDCLMPTCDRPILSW
jgi:hypothetical protein